MTPCQNATVQTSQNNFPTYHQPQTAGQMQTTPSTGYPGNTQGMNQQNPFSFLRADPMAMNQQYGLTSQTMQPVQTIQTNTCQSIPCQSPPRQPTGQACPAAPCQLPPYQPAVSMPCQPQSAPNPWNVPSITGMQQNFLPDNILEQLRACIGSNAPIFILPQMPGPQQPPTNQPPANSNYFPPLPYPFVPYPVPLPMYNPFKERSAEKSEKSEKPCICCRRNTSCIEAPRFPPTCCKDYDKEEHRCTATNDDTICSKRNCPSAIHLQALASQFLSVSGIISCAATRLLLRKIPGSNITTSMEETMEKAQNAISVLTKDQLLNESQTAQQVNALINLHITANPPANIIPILTLLQLKVNILKAHVENLINRKIMENQGVGIEVECTERIDPTILALKSNAELREFLATLRQKECNERVNVNYAPYHSQRAIAESRLRNIQNKIRQVEAEFETRRTPSTQQPQSISSQIVRQFGQQKSDFTHFASRPDTWMNSSKCSPDPFAIQLRNPRRLNLNLQKGIGTGHSLHNTSDTCSKRAPSVFSAEKRKNCSKSCGTQSDKRDSDLDSDISSTDQDDKESNDESSCKNSGKNIRTSSDDSVSRDKKKLQFKIDETGNVTLIVTSLTHSRAVPLMRFSSIVDVAILIDKKLLHREKSYTTTTSNSEITKSESTFNSELWNGAYKKMKSQTSDNETELHSSLQKSNRRNPNKTTSTNKSDDKISGHGSSTKHETSDDPIKNENFKCDSNAIRVKRESAENLTMEQVMSDDQINPKSELELGNTMDVEYEESSQIQNPEKKWEKCIMSIDMNSVGSETNNKQILKREIYFQPKSLTIGDINRRTKEYIKALESEEEPDEQNCIVTKIVKIEPEEIEEESKYVITYEIPYDRDPPKEITIETEGEETQEHRHQIQNDPIQEIIPEIFVTPTPTPTPMPMPDSAENREKTNRQMR